MLTSGIRGKLKTMSSSISEYTVGKTLQGKNNKSKDVDFSRRKMTVSLLLSAGLLGGCSATGSSLSAKKSTRRSGATGSNSIQSKDRRGYALLDPPISATAGNGKADSSKVEVSFLFAYACPPCYDVEELISPWAAKNSAIVNYSKELPPLNASWERDARLFYSLKQIQRPERFIDQVYAKAKSDRSWLRSNISMVETIASMDSSIDEGELLDTMHSNEVDAKLQRSRMFAEKANITVIPSIIINGKYVLDPATTGGFNNIIRVVDGLVKYEIEQGNG